MAIRAILLVLLLPITAAAQDAATAPVPDRTADVTSGSDSGVLLPPSTAEQTTARKAAAPADPGPKRRPSMVGYIADGTITSQVRVRFDDNWKISSPDRAEFFYGKCGCYRDLPSSSPAFDPDAAGPGPGILSEGSVQQLFVLGEYAFSPRLSAFAELPVRWLKPDEFLPGTGSFENQSGLSDLRLGAKLGVMSNDKGHATVLVQLTTPTGDSRKGLGTNHASIEPALVASQQLGAKGNVEGEFGFIIPIGGSAGVPTSGSDGFAGSVLYYGIGPSIDVYSTSTVRIAPVVELVGWHVMSGFQTLCDGQLCAADASGINIVNIKVGARVVMRDQHSIYAGWGKGLTEEKWYGGIFRVEYRRAF